jgi:hypothetical protein
VAHLPERRGSSELAARSAVTTLQQISDVSDRLETTLPGGLWTVISMRSVSGRGGGFGGGDLVGVLVVIGSWALDCCGFGCWFGCLFLPLHACTVCQVSWAAAFAM